MSERIYIERIDIIEFGKLKNLTFKPSEGLNLLSAPNESGKTTLASFIKFILYGFSGTRKQSAEENERMLYTPWSGTRSAGGLTVNVSGVKFRTERSVNSGKETLEIFEIFTKRPVKTDMTPGELFFKLSEDAFNKILFFKQLYVPKNNDDALAWQVQNLLFSADEQVNADNSVKALKDAIAELQNRQKRGIIPRLEEKQRETEDLYEKSVIINRDLAEVSAMINEKRQLIQAKEKDLYKLGEEKKNILKYEAKLRLDEYEQTSQRLDASKQKYEAALKSFRDGNLPDEAALDSLINDDAAYKLSDRKAEELGERLATEEKNLTKIKTESPFFKTSPDEIAKKFKKINLLFLTAAAVIITVTAGFGVYSAVKQTEWNMSYIYLTAAAVIGCAAAAFKLLQNSTAKSYGFANKNELDIAIASFPVIKLKAEEQKERIIDLEVRYNDEIHNKNEIEKRLDSRLKDFIASDGRDIREFTPLVQSVLRASNEIGTLKAEYLLLEEQHNRYFLKENPESLRELAAGAEIPKREKQELERYLAFTTQSIENLRIQENEYEKRKAALVVQAKDPALLFGKNEAMKSKIAELKIKYRALELAVEELEASRDHMKSTVSPKLAELAGGYFSIMTGGKYTNLSLSSDFFMEFEAENANRSVDFLSGGARDAVYLSLRLALVDLLYGETRPFILLDDAFSRIDRSRLEKILKMLTKLAQEQQIFLFTCHKRETELLNAMNIGYYNLDISNDELQKTEVSAINS